MFLSKALPKKSSKSPAVRPKFRLAFRLAGNDKMKKRTPVNPVDAGAYSFREAAFWAKIEASPRINSIPSGKDQAGKVVSNHWRPQARCCVRPLRRIRRHSIQVMIRDYLWETRHH